MKGKLQINSSTVLVLFLVVVVIGFYLAQPTFLSFSNMNNILIQAAAAAIAAVGMTFVVLLADIDLSVGSIMSLSTVVAVSLTSTGSQFDTTTSVWVVPVALLVGVLCGLANAFLINRLKLNSLIVTLGTTSVFLGAALTITQAGTLVLSGALTDLVALRVGAVNLVVLVVLVLAAAAGLFLKYRPNGRLIYAVGGDLRSAHESGLSQAKARYLGFGFLGACSAIAGLITVGQVSTIEANLGADFAFTVITAVVIGGTSLFGGRGGVLGSVLGAVLLATIGSGLNAINASPYVYDVVRGTILILAVLADPIISRVTSRRALLAARHA